MAEFDPLHSEWADDAQDPSADIDGPKLPQDLSELF